MEKAKSGPSFPILLISFWVLLAFSLFSGVAVGEEEPLEKKIEKGKMELQEINRAIVTEKKKVGLDMQREKRIGAELARVRRQLEEKRREAGRLQREIDQAQRRIGELTREIAASESRLTRAKAQLAIRVRSLYKQRKSSSPHLLLAAMDLHQATVNLRYLQAIAHQDRQLVRNFQQEILFNRKQREEMAQQLVTLNAKQEALKAKQEDIARDEQEKSLLLAQVRREKSLSLQKISELQKSSAALQALIDRLQEKMRSARSALAKGAETAYLQGLRFAEARGKLLWPTRGDLVSSFGRKEHPRYRTFSFNKGIDIAAPLGEEIRAVFEGIVLFADWFRGYGKMAIIDHGQGFFSLYAHASELLVKVGDKVAPRQVIGRVGDSGSSEGPLLHFEIRQNGKPVDPLAWLVPNP
jgi:septal ring factor EnvC (AmiA/AmiB activator)